MYLYVLLCYLAEYVHNQLLPFTMETIPLRQSHFNVFCKLNIILNPHCLSDVSFNDTSLCSSIAVLYFRDDKHIMKISVKQYYCKSILSQYTM